MKTTWPPRDLPTLFGDEEVLTLTPSNKRSANRQLSPQNRHRLHQPQNVPSLFNSPDLNDYFFIEFMNTLDAESQKRYQLMKQYAQQLQLQIETGDDCSESFSCYLQHDLFKSKTLEAREYSLAIASTIGQQNGIVIIPTGLGKTYIALLLMPGCWQKNPQAKILFLAPTKPLCNQHLLTMRTILPTINSCLLTGYVAKKSRLPLWQNNSIIIATPQTITAELKKNSGVGRFEDVGMIIIDELHHQTGRYDYVHLVEYYQAKKPTIQFLGFTASPDAKIDTIENWQKQLVVNKQCTQARSFDSPDVLPYIHYRNIIPRYLDRKLTPLQKEFKTTLAQHLTELIKKMAGMLTINISDLFYANEQSLIVGIKVSEFNKLRAIFERGLSRPDKKDKAYQLISMHALAMCYRSAINSLNNGLAEFTHYLQRQYDGLQKSNKKFQFKFCHHPQIKKMVQKLYQQRLWKEELPSCIEHRDWQKDENQQAWQIALQDEKLPVIVDIINKSLSEQVLIFTNYRDTLRKVQYYLNQHLPNRHVGILTGTSSKLHDPGMKQKEQISTLDLFRQQKLDILISTSVGEEGLDFPAVDLVIFYEPIPDIRRYIQRLGRTARHHNGTVQILIYRETEEEKLFNMARHREKMIKEIIKHLQN